MGLTRTEQWKQNDESYFVASVGTVMTMLFTQNAVLTQCSTVNESSTRYYHSTRLFWTAGFATIFKCKISKLTDQWRSDIRLEIEMLSAMFKLKMR